VRHPAFACTRFVEPADVSQSGKSTYYKGKLRWRENCSCELLIVARNPRRFYGASLVYKNHKIVHSGRPFSQRESGFIAAAAISWQTTDGTADVHLLSLIKLYSTEEEASTAALEAAKTWIDRHHFELER
jgi:hypothetical protein